MITQRRERLAAPRAAIPAAFKIPDHLDPRQMRVVPPSRPRTRPAPPAVAARPLPAVPAAVPVPAGRLRPRTLRRAPEHQPLQHRQLSLHPLKLGLPLHISLPQPGVLLPQLPGQPLPPLVGLHRPGQGIPQPGVSIRLHDNASQDRHSNTTNTITTAESRTTARRVARNRHQAPADQPHHFRLLTTR
jgi:hypothetical protein